MSKFMNCSHEAMLANYGRLEVRVSRIEPHCAVDREIGLGIRHTCRGVSKFDIAGRVGCGRLNNALGY